MKLILNLVETISDGLDEASSFLQKAGWSDVSLGAKNDGERISYWLKI